MVFRLHLFVLIFLFNYSAYGQVYLYLDHEIPISDLRITRLTLSQDGRFLSCGDESGKVYVWDVQANKPLYKCAFHKGPVHVILFNSNSKKLYTVAEDGYIAVWDLYSGQRKQLIQYKGKTGQCADLSPDDKLIALASHKSIYLSETISGRPLGVLAEHKKEIIFIAFDLSGSQLISIDQGGRMLLWNVINSRLIRTIKIEPYTMKNSGLELLSAKCSRDKYFILCGIEEHVLAKGGRDMIFRNNLSIYNWDSGIEMTTLTDFNASKLFTVSPDKKYVILDNSTLHQPKLSLVNLEQGLVEKNIPFAGGITDIDISDNGQWLAAAVHYKKPAKKSVVGLWKVSGIQGFERFSNQGKNMMPMNQNRLGPMISFNTAREPLISYGEIKRIAIFYFDNPGFSEDVAKTATYLIESKIGNNPFVRLVERNQIDKVLEELNYQMSGMTTSDAAEVGKHLNADYILLGSINRLGNMIIMTVKLVNVETSRIEGTREVQCKNATIENISDIVSAIVPSIVRN